MLVDEDDDDDDANVINQIRYLESYERGTDPTILTQLQCLRVCRVLGSGMYMTSIHMVCFSRTSRRKA